MSDYEAVYNAKLTQEQLTSLKQRLGIAVEVADHFGGGDYNLGLLWSEREEDFLAWCEENGIEAKFV